MQVQDIVDTARYSELSSVAIKDNTSAIVSFLNLGMLELYKRFPLNTEEHIITLQEGVTLYDLPTDFMYALGAYQEVEEGSLKLYADLPINDEDEPQSIFFPNHKQVQVAESVAGDFVAIIYVTKPPKYSAGDMEIDVDIPDALIEPLLHYIGYKAHLGVRGDVQGENNAHYLRFDRSCEKARELGVCLTADSWRMTNRISDRGFV